VWRRNGLQEMTKPRFFRSQKEWCRWLEKNHANRSEQWVGFHKVASDKKGITYKQALDEALCFGWIDGIRKSIDHRRWMIRFTPRRPGSIWSAVNIERIEELKALDLMREPGLVAYDNRDRAKQQRYSFENEPAALAPAYDKLLRADKQAAAFFDSMPPSYRRPAIWWVMSAKQEATRQRRLAMLIADSAAGRKIKHLRRPGDA
jgi:uncharacterized protein YdeI (YjbR/CyaY-like superfamily)